MDFKIDIDGQTGDMTFTKEDTVLNNIWISLNVRKGSFFQNPEFGLESIHPGKNTEANAARVREKMLSALKWIKDAGRVDSIDVTTEIDKAENINRLKALITAVQADGRIVTFETFLTIV